MIIAVVGAGGKTTRIHHLADKFRQEGKTVFVTTTTHMYQEDECVLSGKVDEIREKVEKCGYCMAGMPAENGKIKALQKEVYEQACQFVDVVLVEADGSKGFPIKYPAEHEPVIPENAEEIHVVIGLNSLGKPFGEVCHRKELAKECLGITTMEERVTVQHLKLLLERGYLEPLRKKYPEKVLKICPGQVNTKEEQEIAAYLSGEWITY